MTADHFPWHFVGADGKRFEVWPAGKGPDAAATDEVPFHVLWRAVGNWMRDSEAHPDQWLMDVWWALTLDEPKAELVEVVDKWTAHDTIPSGGRPDDEFRRRMVAYLRLAAEAYGPCECEVLNREADAIEQRLDEAHTEPVEAAPPAVFLCDEEYNRGVNAAAAMANTVLSVEHQMSPAQIQGVVARAIRSVLRGPKA